MGTVTVLAPVPQPRPADASAMSCALAFTAAYGREGAFAVLGLCEDGNRLAERIGEALKALPS